MKQITTTMRIQQGRPLTDSTAVMWLKDILRPILSKVSGMWIPYKISVACPCQQISGKPIILAVNHGCFADTPIMVRIAPERPYILSGTQRLQFTDWLYFLLTGVIFVDRKDKQDTAAAKQAMIAYLRKGRSILMFPEGTWNLTPAQLMMPMKWGCIEVAQQSGAQIIPVGLDYDRNEHICRVRFGQPMAGEMLENKLEAIRALRDTMAALRWEMMCSQPVLHRGEITPELLQEEMYQAIQEYPPLNWKYESSYIYHPETELGEVFAHLGHLQPRRENAWLFRNT